MRRSRTLLFALMVALVASFAMPLTASAGGSSSSGGSDELNCADVTQEEADQLLLDDPSDPNRLDEDPGEDDLMPCEGDNDNAEEDAFEEAGFTDASVDEYPREGIASGGGSTAAEGPSPLPLLVSAGAFALLAAGSGGFAMRRRLSR